MCSCIIIKVQLFFLLYFKYDFKKKNYFLKVNLPKQVFHKKNKEKNKEKNKITIDFYIFMEKNYINNHTKIILSKVQEI